MYRGACIGLLILLGLGTPGHAAALSAAGVSCLQQIQNPDGSWGQSTGSAVRDTTVVVDSLRSLGHTGLPFSLGVDYLQGSIANNHDSLARQIVTLARANRETAVLAATLFNGQDGEVLNPADPTYPAGGWGLGPRLRTDTLTTALALTAVKAVGFAPALSVVGAVVQSPTQNSHAFSLPADGSNLSILIRSVTGSVRLFIQTPAGGTSSVDLTNITSPTTVTGLLQQAGTYILRVQSLSGSPNTYSLEVRFQTVDVDAARVSRALSYLGHAQNADGSWGIRRGEPGLLMVTAEVLRTLAAYGTALAPQSIVSRGLDWLQMRQHADGGFGNEATSTVYETALALLALHDGGRNSLAIIDAARSFLASQQGGDGCWNGDSYSTAVTLNSLDSVPGGTPTITATASRTASFTRTPTPTATIPPQPAVDFDHSAQRPGGIACVAGSLLNIAQIAATSNDMDFDATQLTPIGCAINPGIGAGTAANKQLTDSPLAAGSQREQVGGNLNPIPIGALYTCRFAVAPLAPLGVYAINNTASAIDTSGNPVIIAGAAGQIIVTTCTGDCNGNHQVSIGEVTKCVNLFLGQPLCNPSDPVGNCPVADANLSGTVSIGEVTQCINRFLGGCP